MKMKNLVAYAMLALGAVAAPFAAMAGDIAEIRPWLDTREDVNEELKAGQSLKFVVRLASRSIEAPAQWEPVYLGGGSQLLPQLYMPKMGLVLSGKLRYAELISWGPNIKKGEVFTDLIFEYVVQPGDFAQPALLALSTSTELQPVFADTTRSGGEQSYFLKNVVGYDPAGTMFKFADANGNECAFSYMALNDERMNKLSSKWPEGGQNLDIDLAGELNHYMLKSIDFDDRTEVDSEDGVTYWRVVKEGDTQTLAYNPRIETIGIYGTNAVQIGSAPRYYVWSDNEDAVTLEKAKGAKRMTLHPPKADGTKSEGKDVWVYTFDLVTGQQAYEFAVYGVAQGKKANLILSGSSDYAYNSAGTVVTNFLVSPLAVKCGAKPPPSIRLTWQETGKAGYNPETGDPAICVYTNDISEIAEQGHQIAVEVRNGTFSVPVTLVLKARVENGDDWDYVYTNSLIRTAICEPGDIPEFVPTEPQVEVKFTPGGSLMKNIFVYPIGSEVKSGTKGQYVEFKLEWGAGTPQEIKDAFMSLSDVCTLRAVDAVPAVISPQAGDVFQIEDPIPVMVMDSYRDLTPPRKFETRVRYGQQTLYITTNSYSSTGPTEITLDRAKVLGVLRQKKEEYEADVQIEVSDPLKQKGTCAIKLVIPALPPEQPMVYAELYDSTSEGSLHPSADFKEGEAPIVRFRLDTPLAVDSSGANDRYAFLVPQNWASSNLVKYAGLENGVLIAGGKTNSVLSLGAQMKLLDGCAETDMSQNRQMSFAIVLKTASGDVDTTYRPDPNGLQFTVQNVKPVSQGLFINGSSDSTPDGGRFPVEISSGIEQTFVASYAEAYDWPDAKNVDLTNGIVTVWCFTDGKSSNTYRYSAVTSTTDTATCMHSFTYAGGADQQVKWIPVDKDMMKQLLGDTPLTAANLQSLWPSLLKIATPYTATVHVGDAPHIVLGQEETFVREDSKTDKVQITLSEPYDGGSIFLKVTLTALDEYAEEPGHASFQQAVLEIERGALEPKKTTKYNNGLKFDYEELDGTAVSAMDGFFLEVDAYEDAACTIPVSRYAKAEGYVYVDNVPPAITPKEPENLTTNKTLSVNEAFTLQWSVNDVKRDLARGLTCKWYIDDNVQGDLTKVVTDKLAKETTLKFTSDGFHEVRLEVEDKDGEDVDGKATRRWFYYISPTKALEVKAVGPGLVTKTKYGTAAGRGEGRVWANGIKGVAEAFAQTWTYGVKTTEAEVHAYGYAASNTVYRDNGNLGGKGRDLAIDVNGDSFGETVVEADCYQVSGIYDNYFYRWVFLTATEGGGAATASFSALEPTVQPTLDVKETVALDPYEENKESFALSRVEAVFSREYLMSDNMGDINRDGIPDLILLKYGFGIVDESGNVTGNDLEKISGFNNDQDFLPTTETSVYGALIPQLPESWQTLGTPFDAKTEIRGYHEGLNDAFAATLADGTANPGSIAGVKPDRVYEMPDGSYNAATCTISRLEYLAWKESGLPADKWSPERPTDPTLADTDDDGFSDGYEYYFWYRAHVGYLENEGTANERHRYLTGRRYNPAKPGEPDLITSEEIAALMDPLVSSGDKSGAKTRDTDNDGLPDLVEFELGTNPFDFDTDGDGLPDGYEVMLGTENGFDPLLWSTAKNAKSDAEQNADGDTMAELVNEEMTTVGIAQGDGSVVYYATEGAGFETALGDEAAGTGTVIRVVSEDGARTNLYLTTSTVTTNVLEGRIVLACDLDKASTWSVRMSDTNETRTVAVPVRGASVRLARGTVFPGTVTIEEEQEFFDEVVTAVPDLYWSTWIYGVGGGLAIGRENLHHGGLKPGETILSNRVAVAARDKQRVRFLHYQVYQQLGFDPRTGWKRPPDSAQCVNTRLYTALDEFLVMAFFHQDGVLDAGELVPSQQRPFTDIWSLYCTDPLKADTDDDGMPDGWELYVMAGPKVYDTKDDSPTKGDRIYEYGPRLPYSPLMPFGDIPDAGTRDNDTDGLEWPNEYSGSASSAEYSETCATIVNLKPEWRNKKWPTDPWNGDTDGDGLTDGEEGTHFIYGDPEATGMAGGGLDPLSWDTDADFLPDPWEVEFAGHYIAGKETKSTTTSQNEDGSTNTTVSVTREAGVWEGGMDGTVDDARLDYDNDGLCNWQEYMTGAVRAWRYDDTVSPWDNLALPLDPFGALATPDPSDAEAWGTFWGDLLVNPLSDTFNPRLVDGRFDGAQAYFSTPTNVFEQAKVKGFFYMFKDGIYHDLKTPFDTRYKMGDSWANRFTYKPLMAGGGLYALVRKDGNPIYPTKYICCDPTNHDSDFDGLDDYYEVFHGLNPLLGERGMDKYAPVQPFDVVYWSYGGDEEGPWSAGSNYWIDHPWQKPRTKGLSSTPDDFEVFPWLAGEAKADPDGDNIRNQQEGIMPNVQAASTYLHTDPTPLWMTDSTYSRSIPRRYYLPGISTVMPFPGNGDSFVYEGKEYHFTDFPWFSYDEEMDLVAIDYDFNDKHFGVNGYHFSFEENEGYDSDHDYLSDFEEAQGKTKSASDPQDHDDPLRRQAMYFNGTDAFLQTPLPASETVAEAAAGSEPRQNFLYYTVECWAKADAASLAKDGVTRVLVERAVVTGESNPGDEEYLRKNFQLGVRNGLWYTKFDSTGTDRKQAEEITDGPGATTDWTHLAATYDGTTLRLYVNGRCSNEKATRVQPEHGSCATRINEAGEITPGQLDYATISILVGAGARTTQGVTFDALWRGSSLVPTTIADYTGFFKGYVDEVTIWDGARPGSDIRADYENRVRMTRELALDNRQVVYANWLTGARRSPVSDVQLPPQLMYHWAFDHVAGAILPQDLMKVPAGFDSAYNVVDAKALWSRPEGWTNPWRASASAFDPSIKSTVFTDDAWVPWINDTVAHLPRFDKTTLDSVYWSEDFAGATPSGDFGYQKFAFPRRAEVYSKWTQQTYDAEHQGYSLTQRTRWDVANSASNDVNLAEAYRFALRDRDRTGFDLLPFGGAYPRRISAAEGGMWDDQGASDAWAENGKDSNNNGLPDWWEEYARNNYCEDLDPFQPLEWDTPVTYHGITLRAWQAYLRDLASGMAKEGSRIGIQTDEEGNAIYADTRDVDADGLPDWWEELYGVQGYAKADADADPDNDGLSNYAEYLLGEVYPFAYAGIGDVRLLNPTLMHSVTNQLVTDYFLRYSTDFKDVKNDKGRSVFYLNEYFGEIATDHDFMEDWWENQFAKSYASAKVYDPLDDADEDGWSNWAECRATLWGGHFDASLIDRWTGSDSSQHVACYPEPIIGIRATYHGLQDVSGSPLVIRMTTGQTPRTDATFVVPSTLDSQTRYIGPFAADFALHGHMSPGHLNGNSIVFERAKFSSDKTYVWNCDWYIENEEAPPVGWGPDRTHTGSFETYRNEFLRWPKIELEGGDLSWEPFTEAFENGNVADIYGTGVKLGTANITTGEYELDMSKFEGDVSTYVFRVTYTSRIGYEWPQAVYVSDTKELASGAGAGVAGQGRIREGRNTIEAFLDLNGNGTFDEGEPFGTARNVMVGWHKVPETVIELKDESPIMTAVAVGGAEKKSGGSETSITIAENEDGSITMTEKTAAAETAAAALTKTVRIVRETINGQSEFDGLRLKERTLLTKEIVLDDHPYLTEADVCTVSKPDLDWTWLLKDAAKVGLLASDVKFAGYRVDEVIKLADGTTTNIEITTFSKDFPGARPAATAVEPLDGTPVYSASPTLSFSVSDTKATGYRLQIRKRGATELTYDSGVTILPGRTGSAVGAPVCAVTPPVYAGAPVTAGITTNRAVFADGTNYQWRVALYDAKYNATADDTDASAEWSKWASFEMDARNENRYPRQATGYGNASLTVRYYGPNTNELAGAVVVEAFETADFRGQPLAQLRLTNLTELASIADITTPNAVLRGLKPGKVFFRAYVDQNDNGSRDKWESWGYANMVGQGFKAIYNPDPMDITVSTADWVVGKKADRVIYIEDCDANKNEIPDCLEPGLFPATGGDETEEDITDPTLDTDGDGMPDAWEDWNDGFTDPTIPDADAAEPGDVMACIDETRYLVTFADGTQLLLAYGETYREAENRLANAYRYDSWYRYGGSDSEIYGVGTNVTVASTTLEILRAELVTARLVHAQVYARKGYDVKTANPVAYADGTAVDTKAFTALDKLMVLRYLQAIGATPENPNPEKYKDFEEYVRLNGSGVWSQWTLMPGEIDYNHDKIADGWQLYVMFGARDMSAAIGGLGPVTPWGSIGATRQLSPGGEGLSWSQEYDGGNCPTDPWSVDTDKDGISDYYACNWHLKGEQYRQDYDNDGLSNFQEFLSSVALTNSLGTPVIAANRMKTYERNGQMVPDYFLRVGSLYVGEILTDHDFIEDWLEDSDALFSGDRKASRYQYDAHLDADGNGWDNWSEARAYLVAPTSRVFAGVKTNVVTKTGIATQDEALKLLLEHDEEGVGDQSGSQYYYYHDEQGQIKWAVTWREFEDVYRDVVGYTGRPTPTGRIKVVYNGESAYAGNLVIQSFRCVDGTVPGLSAKPDATWILPVGMKSAWYELSSPTNGFVRGGKNLFVVYNDGDADGVWTPGEPYGIVADVDVGYSRIADSEVELTDISSATLRIRLGQAVRTAGYAAQNVLTDRGVKPSRWWPNAPYAADVSYTPVDESESSVRIRLVRLSINDVTTWPSKGRYAMTVVMDFPLTYISDDLVFDEFTLLSQGKFEPSWGTLQQAWADIGFPSTPQDISKVTYGFAIGPGDLHPDRPGEDNFLDVTFSLGYEALSQQTKAVPTGALTKTDDNRPTFTWTHANTIGKAYPAFRLRVYRKSDKKLMYDSNEVRAPVRNSEGVYSWRPPLYAGVKTPTGEVFDNGEYYFTVSMLDAKFTTPNTNEQQFEFTLNANGLGGDLSDQYSIFTAVKYFGPAETNKTIRVEAFESPDFAGQPAAVTSVRNCDDLMTTNSVTLNAMLIGLEAGKPYYVRAFIDSNENGVKDDIESWGYGNFVGTDRRDLYTPRAYAAKKGSFQMPEAVVYIEDVDRNNDGIPDARTDLTVTPTNSPYVVTYDGSVAGAKPVATNLFAAMGDGALLLPFVSQLRTLENGGTLSALQLYYAMAQGDVPSVAQLKTASDVRVTSFSLEDGIRIAVSTRTTVDGKTLLPKVSGLSYSVKLQVKVWHVNELTGTWAELTPRMDPIEVPVNAVDETIAPDKLNQINTQVRALATEASGFYKVEVEVVP